MKTTMVVALGLIALGILGGTVVRADTAQYQVAASADDAATTSSGCNYATPNIFFPYSYAAPNDRPGFFRWAINIPAGATVTSAYLKVNSYATTTAAAVVRLQLIDSDSCPALNSPNPYSYATTAGYVDWTLPGTWTQGSWYTSPDIGSIVQEFVNRAGYTAGNYLGLKENLASGGLRQVCQWDYDDHSYGAILEINYVAGNIPPTGDAGSDQTVTDTDNSGYETVTLDGSGSSDSDGTIVSWVWTEGATTLATDETANVSLAVGTHTIILAVTDDESATAEDTVVVTVNGPSAEKTVTMDILVSEDDAKCFESYVQHTGEEIYFPYYNTTRLAVWRMKSLVPPNATITDARMKLKMYYVGSATASTGRIQLFDYDDCPTFSTANNPWGWDLVDPTNLYVDWVFPSTLAVDDWTESPDMSDIVQEFIDRTNYEFGNYIGLRGTPVSGNVKMVYDSYVDETTSDPSKGAQLEVTYTGGDAVVELRMADPHVRIGQLIYVYVVNADSTDTLRVTLTDPSSNDAVLFEKTGGLANEDEICFEADWSNLTSGEYTLTAEVISSGSTVRGSDVYTWTRLHSGVPKVGLDVNNNFCLRDANGDPQPFIPVTSFLLGKNAFATHPVYPRINTLLGIGYYPTKDVAAWEDYIETGWNDGLYSAGPAAWDTKAPHATWYQTSTNDLISFINGTKDEDGLLAWFWMDEPDLYQSVGSTVEPITTREWTTLSHQYDTDHPVWVNYEGYTYSLSAPAVRYQRSVDWLFETNEHIFGKKTLLADVIGLDYYPYEYTTKFDNALMSDFMDTIDRVRTDNRDLCATVIFIETQDVRDPNAEGHPEPWGYWPAGGEYEWTPDPEPRMLKNEFWLALIHGVKGISYFHYFCPIPANLQATMSDFLTDVTDLTPVICSQENAGPEVTVTATNSSGDPQDPDYLANPRIDLTTRFYGDPDEEDVYIFAADMRDLLGATKDDRVVGEGYARTFYYSPDTVSARFYVEDLPSGVSIEVYGESRTITSVSGYFDDTFDPYGVHIYILGSQPQTQEKSYQVAASGDDTYWYDASVSWTTAAEAYCPYINSTRGGGFRWELDIPDGATIVSAVIKLKATGVNGTGTSALTFEVLDYDSCPSFTGGTAPQVDSAMSGVSETWSIPTGDWTAGTWYSSCDVTDLVQAFIDRANYSSGNYLGIRATSGAGTYHKTYQYDHAAADAPILEVTYTP